MVLLAVLECFENDERWLDQAICVIEGAALDLHLQHAKEWPFQGGRWIN